MSSAPFPDALLWYCPPGFADMGLAIPNWGANDRTLNSEILEVADLIGRSTQAILLDPDAMVSSPPRLNTVLNVCSMCERAFTLITGHMTAEGVGVTSINPQHTQDWQPFRVYPTPYARVVNGFLKKYAGLALNAQTELMKHGDNARPLFLSQALAGQVIQYISLIYTRVSTDLLGVQTLPMKADGSGVPQFDPADPRSPQFRLTPAQKAAYSPSKIFTSIEQTAVAPSPVQVPNEIQLLPITQGQAVPDLPIATGVKQFPSSSTSAPPAAASASVAASATVSASVSLPPAPGSLAATSPTPPSA